MFKTDGFVIKLITYCYSGNTLKGKCSSDKKVRQSNIITAGKGLGKKLL